MHPPTLFPALCLLLHLAASLPHTSPAGSSLDSFDERDVLGQRDLLDTVGGTVGSSNDTDTGNSTTAAAPTATTDGSTTVSNPKRNPLFYAAMASAVVDTDLPPPTRVALVASASTSSQDSSDNSSSDSASSSDANASTDSSAAADTPTSTAAPTTTVRHGRLPLTTSAPSTSTTDTSSDGDDSGHDQPEFLTSTDGQGQTYLVKNPKYVQNPKYKKTTSTSTLSSTSSKSTVTPTPTPTPKPTGCFPAQSLAIPTTSATSSQLSSWWCDQKTEYAFMGFSYDQTPCQSYSSMLSDFKLMRSQYQARYVRLYGFCDNSGYLNDMVNAAAGAGLGVYSLIWFGFDGSDIWKTRMAKLVSVIQTNSNAPYVIRNVALGSEPLFDWVMSESDLAVQILALKKQLSAYGMQITMSEMPYGFQSQGDGPHVFAAIDIVEGNVLPFFDSQATTGGNAWGVVSWSISYFQQHAPGKLIRMTQTGWPSNTNIWKANTPSAVASVSSEKAYYDLLNSHCSDLKGWGVGWFAHIWSDGQLDGWGLLDQNGKSKFTFAPKITC